MKRLKHSDPNGRMPWLLTLLAASGVCGLCALYLRVMPMNRTDTTQQILRVNRIPGIPPWPQLSFHPEGDKIVVSGMFPGERGTQPGIRVLDVRTGLPGPLIGSLHDLPISVAISYDGRFVGASDIHDRMAIWDMDADGAQVELADGFRGWPLRFHPSKCVCAFVNTADPGKPSCQVLMADHARKEILHRLDHSGVIVHCIAFSPDGKCLATGADDGKIRLWDVTSGMLVRVLSGHGYGITSVAYAPAGDTVASGAWGWKEGRAEAEIIIWDLQTPFGRHLEAFHSKVESLTFSRDARILATVGGMTRGELGVWDPATGKLLAKVEGERGKPFWIVSCSPSEDRLALSVHDGSIEVWDFAEVGVGQ